MKKISLIFFLLPVCAFAVQTTDCSTATQLAALYQVRALMLRPDTTSYDVNKYIDAQMDAMRDPLPDGGFRWVRWTRPSGSPEYDKNGHTVAAVQGSGSDNFEASGDHIYAVRIAVPSKRSMFNGNNAVYVGTVHIRATANGRTRTLDERIGDWMNRDTTKTIDLNMIADHVDVSLDSAAKPGRANESLVEIHMLKAVAQDDPANPNYDAIQTLKRVRNSFDSDSIDDEIARLAPDDTFPLAHFIRDLRRANELMRSNKDKDREKGDRLLRETLRRLR
jgi:hypothetical protein